MYSGLALEFIFVLKPRLVCKTLDGVYSTSFLSKACYEENVFQQYLLILYVQFLK